MVELSLYISKNTWEIVAVNLEALVGFWLVVFIKFIKNDRVLAYGSSSLLLFPYWYFITLMSNALVDYINVSLSLSWSIIQLSSLLPLTSDMWMNWPNCPTRQHEKMPVKGPERYISNAHPAAAKDQFCFLLFTPATDCLPRRNRLIQFHLWQR